MTPTKFPQANIQYKAPSDMHENQVATIHAYTTEAAQGSCDGAHMVVTAWKPTAQEMADIASGTVVFLTCLGGLPPHFLTTRFEQAINPA